MCSVALYRAVIAGDSITLRSQNTLSSSLTGYREQRPLDENVTSSRERLGSIAYRKGVSWGKAVYQAPLELA